MTTLTAPTEAPTPPPTEPSRPPRRAAWAQLAVALAALARGAQSALSNWSELGEHLVDPDDAMRLLRVRGLRAGAGWYDRLELRIDPPGGASIHWSRLIDAPLAALIGVFDRFTDAVTAEKLALAVWPAVLAAGLALVVYRIAARSNGWGTAPLSLGLLLLSWPALVQFRAGRIDHHNVQLLAALVLIGAVSAPRARRAHAVVGAIALATGLAVGLEALPFVVAAAASVGVRFVADPDGRRSLCRDFGLTTVAASVVVTIATVPPSLWTQSACDAWGANHLLALVVGGAGLVAVSRFVGPTQSLGVRLASLGAVGGLAAAAYLAAEPACIGGPYVHIDPWLQEVWLSRISEALSLWDNVEHDPVRFVVPLVVPLVVGVWALARRARRLPDPGGTELLLTVCLFLSVPLGLWQVRALSYTSLFTVVLAAHLGARVAGRLSRADRTPIAIGLIVAAVLLTNDVSVSLVSSVVAPPATEQAAETTPPPDGGGAGYEGCSGLSEYAGLAELQPTLIAAEVDIAPYVLLSSQHQVVGANYHRAVRGVRDTFRILTAEPDAARAVVAERDVGMILLCETGGSAVTARMFPDGLAARLRRGEVPSWLAPVDVGDDALLAFRVLDPPAS